MVQSPPNHWRQHAVGVVGAWSLPDCIVLRALIRTRKERTKRAASPAKRMMLFYLLPKGEGGPGAGRISSGTWAGAAFLCLVVVRSIHSLRHSVTTAAAAAATSDLCSSASDSDIERPMKQAVCCISMHVSTRDYSNSAAAWTENRPGVHCWPEKQDLLAELPLELLLVLATIVSSSVSSVR